MNWEDEGFLLVKRKFRENANIINVFTNNRGKVSGIVYGGNSRKIRNFLQISNKIFLSHNSKGENRIGYFKTELIQPIAPIYFNDKKRTSALLSIGSILNSILPDSQPYRNVYNSLNDLIKNLNDKNWIILYIFWELNLIKELGFDQDLASFKNNSSNGAGEIEIIVDGTRYKIPKYLVTRTIPREVTQDLIRKSLIFTRNALHTKFFLPNNLIFPKSRIILENYFA